MESVVKVFVCLSVSLSQPSHIQCMELKFDTGPNRDVGAGSLFVVSHAFRLLIEVDQSLMTCF